MSACPTCRPGAEVACPVHPDPPHRAVEMPPGMGPRLWYPAPGDRVVASWENAPEEEGELLRALDGLAWVRWDTFPSLVNLLAVRLLRPARRAR